MGYIYCAAEGLISTLYKLLEYDKLPAIWIVFMVCTEREWVVISLPQELAVGQRFFGFCKNTTNITGIESRGGGGVEFSALGYV